MVIPREPFDKAQGYNHERSRVGRRRDYTSAPRISKFYLLGLLHDATERRSTFRIGTKDHSFATFLKGGIKGLDQRAWIYREGQNRKLWIVEFNKQLLKGISPTKTEEKIDYVRGYFDAEGGIAKASTVRFYLYFAQKDRGDLEEVKGYLEEVGIACGVIHNPSRKIDPKYWRFFIRAKSYSDFARKIGSFHPEKLRYLRMKI